MENIIHFFIFIPLTGFILSLFVPDKKESAISYTAFGTIGITFLLLLSFSAFWLSHGHPPLHFSELVLYQSSNYEFVIAFYLDKISLVYLFVGILLTLMVTIYSRYYMHREPGYKRFFNTILFFFTGYAITVLSGNFETLFLGWEILGISSFLLIAFYRNRYLPLKNGIKVFSIYRIGDVGILLAMWMSHHLWHENITFIKLNNDQLVHEHLQNHSMIGVFISLSILIAACAKSAQLPFTSWLPRAMEGPTPSSAIFYGSLSVHIGVFLLLRSFPFWEHQYSVRIVIALVGLATAIVSTFIAHVQSSVKSQIAYASAAQIGLIFIEVAAGFELLALFHFAGNAFLRTYQLLVSPSLVSYLIKEQFFHFIPREHVVLSTWRKKLNYTFYLLSLKEFNLDWFMYRYVWGLLKETGRRVSYFKIKQAVLIYSVVLIAGVFTLYHQEYIPFFLKNYMSVTLAVMGLILVLRSFVERKRARMAFLLIILNHCFIVLAVSYNERFDSQHSVLYLSGVMVTGLIGYICLQYVKRRGKYFGLNQFYGYSAVYKKTSFIFLLACLGLSGFPITPTFIGEDLIFSHIHQHQLVLASIVSVSLIVDGITLIRIYSRIFLGPYIGQPSLSPFRSS